MSKRFFSLFILFILLLVGCGSSGGGFWEEIFPTSSTTASYYDSESSIVENLTVSGKTYSAYNEQSSLEIKNIPIVSERVLYECLVTNPNSSAISELYVTPPTTYNFRASIATDTKNDDSLCDSSDIMDFSNIKFRENPITKDKLKQELYNKYLENEANNKRLSIRANSNHQNEVQGDKDISITVLNKSRNCTLAKVSNYGKFFVDQDKDGSIAAPKISDASLEQFATEFDYYIYPILKEYFGDGTDIFWHDVDNDEKLSIVFSPIVNNYGDNVAGVFDTSSINYTSNPRDMISIAVMKSGDEPYEKWFMDARETLAHEMQHIVNFSAKRNQGTSSEILWIDEGLAVCSEILYRNKRSQEGLMTFSLYYGGEHLDFPGDDARFYYASYYMPELTIQNFDYGKDTNKALAHYGQKGLFFYYIYEQYGKETLRQICQGARGTSKFSSLITDRTLEQLSIDFNFACLNEKLRNVTLSNYLINPYDVAYSNNQKHIFKTNLNLNFSKDNNGQFHEVSKNEIENRFVSLDSLNKIDILKDKHTIPANGGTVRFFLEQPSGFSNLVHTNNYTLTFTSSKPVVVNMVRVSQ